MHTEYLASLEKFGINLGLERIRSLLALLDNPQNKFKTIHVAGTNGKGSTCAMIASILKEAGYKVGFYTSPHLFKYNERIKVNGKDISDGELEEGIRRLQKAAEGIRGEGRPTVFEVLTALAFWYFAKQKVDYAVIEVGMGGRLDASNVIFPEVSVITNIDLEHTKVLGSTLTKIAREKAAIIKPGIPVVTAETKNEPLNVIKKVCRKNNANLIVAEPVAKSVKLMGIHQRLNTSCALAAVKTLNIKISEKAIQRGLAKVIWPARFQIISKKPLTIVDGAHNPAGIKVLVESVKTLYPGQRFTIIFGCQTDKNCKPMLKSLRSIAKKRIITRSSHQNSAKLKNSIDLDAAVRQWNRNGPLIICGSLFLCADAIKHLDVKMLA